MTMNKFEFGSAVSLLKSGKHVKRYNWDDNTYITLQIPDEHSKMTKPYIYMFSSDDVFPWFADHSDILSEDWIQYE